MNVLSLCKPRNYSQVILAEAPDGIRLPGDPTGPSALRDGIGGMALLTTLCVDIGFLAMVDQNHGIRAKYLLNPVIDNLHLSGIVLVTLVDLPIDIDHYEVRLRLFQQLPTGFTRFTIRDNTWKLKYRGIGHKHVSWESDPALVHLLKPIPPDQLRSIKLEIQYSTRSGHLEAQYWFPACDIDRHLESKEGLTHFRRSRQDDQPRLGD